MSKEGLPEIQMDYQEKILYMGLLTIVKMLIEIVPDDEFESVFSNATKEDILGLNAIIEQRLDEIKKYNDLG